MGSSFNYPTRFLQKSKERIFNNSRDVASQICHLLPMNNACIYQKERALRVCTNP